MKSKDYCNGLQMHNYNSVVNINDKNEMAYIDTITQKKNIIV